MEEIKNKLILHLRLNKVDNAGIIPPILLHELLVHKKFKCELQQGFISMSNQGHCWHLWIKTEDETVMDINHDIACHINEYFKAVEFDLTPIAPEKYDKDDTQVSQWELYNEDKKKFWKEQPMNMKNFRAKMFRTFKNK